MLLCRNYINNSIKLAPQKIKIMRFWQLTVSLCLWYKIFQISYWFLQLSGSQTQIQRLKAMERLKQFKCRVLISTDLVSYILWFLSFFFFLLVLVRSSMSNFYFIVKLKQVQVYFMTKHCWPYDFNLPFNSQVINMKLLPKISINISSKYVMRIFKFLR